MRAYFFTNFYLNTISQGIQPAHCVVRMLRAYSLSDQWTARERLHDWADNHETIISLNGGAYEDIVEIHTKLVELGKRLEMPVGCFHEDKYSLNGIMTCCGIVVTERIYALSGSKTFDQDVAVASNAYTADEIELATLIRSCPLAR